MRIFYEPGQDPMVLDSLAGMSAVHGRIREFVESDARSMVLDAKVSGDPAPYTQFLRALEFEVSGGPIVASISPQNHLKIVGSRENLATYARFFAFGADEEGSHHHPEYLERPGYIAPNSLSVILEADTDHIQELEGES